mmetsp:Transcript_39032/g.84923  ORF Transcript_39032/g.84923 Transcript_39032/m.84923 type:complete len:359 (-) Transcript_39032:258-1334(-)|eukprot:CAMPEP_0118931582 /NCGR_PEP_ID=MMETSP1169-20130426/7870_1 /TAXON_ID=36882 /ORGANISM="Pyramimonas obovata, Strain CCMP722" /LENGTH=358 /DNA_ID=CAMNT_0006874095 /DNA_START=98 /DNA_END=1174 /DNA_ORIENTATION=-
MSSTKHLTFACLLVFTLQTSLVHASKGDEAEGYRNCVLRCVTLGRAWWPGMIDGTTPSMCARLDTIAAVNWEPWYLRMTGWSCEDDCKYHCMHLQEEHRSMQGLSPVKYYGKWPFVRAFGHQEICSSMFSLLNLAAHLYGYMRLRKVCLGLSEHARYPYFYLLTISAVLNINSWFWSWLFHMRDTPLTERLDYLSASTNIFNGVFLCVVRVAGLQRDREVAAVAAVVALVTLGHMYYMLFVKFDYGWNMQICLLAGVGQACLWMVWVLYVVHPIRSSFILFFIAMHTLMLLEVLDFSPVLWGLVDAHSLWHLLTPPWVLLWYSFFEHDARYNASRHLCVVLAPDHFTGKKSKEEDKDD